MAAATARASAFAANRAVHIKISPQTLNLRESREVLRVLKEYGEVVSFRNFALIPPFHHHHTILAVFQTPEAAASFKEASPLQFTIQETLRSSSRIVASPASFAPDPAYTSQGPPSSKSQTQDNQEDATTAAANVENEESQLASGERSFYLTADTSSYSHMDYIRRQYPYWGYTDRQKSFAREDLERAGSGVPVKGMADIDPWTAEVPQRVVDKNMRHVENRQLRRLGWFKGENINLNRLEKAQERERKEEVARLRSLRRIAAKERQTATITEWDELKASAQYKGETDVPGGDKRWGQLDQLSNERSDIMADDATTQNSKNRLDSFNEENNYPFLQTPRPPPRRRGLDRTSSARDEHAEDLPPAMPIDLHAQLDRIKLQQTEPATSARAASTATSNTANPPSSNHDTKSLPPSSRTSHPPQNSSSAISNSPPFNNVTTEPPEPTSQTAPPAQTEHPSRIDLASSPHTTEHHPQQREYRLLRFNRRVRAAEDHHSSVKPPPGSMSGDSSRDTQAQRQKPPLDTLPVGPWGSLSPSGRT